MEEAGSEAEEEQLGEQIGIVFSYFSKVGVAAINITSGSIKVGDTIRIKGSTTDFTQQVDSMEIDRQKVDTAGVGQSIGILVKDRVRPNDLVYKM
jgi:putative protease